jgi:1-acyl-sn-glycerol-3-phosphate acyltransferase
MGGVVEKQGGSVRGAATIGIAAVMIVIGSFLILVASVVPLRLRGMRLSSWVVTGMARAFCVIFGVHPRYANLERLYAHTGIVLSNHHSAIDTILFLRVQPVRFLSMAEVAKMPFIGYAAKSLGTIFVQRSDPNSRKQARAEVATALAADPQPPVVIFPEGRLGPGTKLLPFRNGAFEIASENGIALLPCAVRYRPLEVAWWRGTEGESMGHALWRLACYGGTVEAEVYVLEAITVRRGDDPATLAKAAQTQVGAALELEVVSEQEYEAYQARWNRTAAAVPAR